jgi:protein-disulfide isomerase
MKFFAALAILSLIAIWPSSATTSGAAGSPPAKPSATTPTALAPESIAGRLAPSSRYNQGWRDVQKLMRSSRIVFFSAVLAVLGLAFATSANAQAGPPTQVHDASALKPPASARVAIVEFDDMECPVCGRVNPTLMQAVAHYNIPWVRHDFPLPYHNWSKQAAINARWFDTQSGKLGDDYRDYIFANQPQITRENLQQYTQNFASSHKVQLPFAVDPQGKLLAAVQADFALGQRVGIEHTPTIWIVASGSRGAPYVEVQDYNRLYQIIDQALADTKSAKGK